jgi:transposase InsO family protein
MSQHPSIPTGDRPAQPEAAPFDPRPAVRQAPPLPPSPWLEPLGEPLPEGDDDPLVIVDDGTQTGEAAEPPPPAAPDPISPVTGATPALSARRPGSPQKGKSLTKPEDHPRLQQFSPAQRLLILDSWKRSGLPAGDFAPLVGVSKHTLYGWKNRFEADGPAGLMDQVRGRATGSRLSEVTKRAIIMMKEANPDWGVERISAMLERGPALGASPGAINRVLKEWGYELREEPTRPHPDKVRRFERATPNQLWQTDLFTFVLKRQNQRVYLVAFLDDHSRFVVSYGLHASQSTALVLEVFRAGIASYGAPAEVLTDNGTQYVTWRGKSQFAHECDKRGITHIVATPRHPQTLGKTERFWGTLWRECLETATFLDLADARTRIGHFIDHYNFQRPHQGIGNLAPADRFFGAAPAMAATLRERVAANALEIARSGTPKAPFYLAGNVNGQAVSVHAAGDRLLMSTGGATPVEVALAAVPSGTPAAGTPPEPLPVPVAPQGIPDSLWSGADDPPPPGVSPLDAVFPLPPRAGAPVAATPASAIPAPTPTAVRDGGAS